MRNPGGASWSLCSPSSERPWVCRHTCSQGFWDSQAPTDQTEKTQRRGSESKGESSQTQLPPLPPSQILLRVPLCRLTSLGCVSGISQCICGRTGADGERGCLLEAASDSLGRKHECRLQSLRLQLRALQKDRVGLEFIPSELPPPPRSSPPPLQPPPAVRPPTVRAPSAGGSVTCVK